MALSEREKADLLASAPLFASIGRAELNHVAQLSTEHEVDDHAKSCQIVPTVDVARLSHFPQVADIRQV